MKQRVLTPQEYANLGYQLRSDYDESLIQLGGYETPTSFDIAKHPRMSFGALSKKAHAATRKAMK